MGFFVIVTIVLLFVFVVAYLDAKEERYENSMHLDPSYLAKLKERRKKPKRVKNY